MSRETEAAIIVSVADESQTRRCAALIAAILQGGEVIGLDGELGAGKTSFVRGLAEGLGVDPAQVTSPTFIVLQKYRGVRLNLVHADAYRLSGADGLLGTGWEEEAGGSSNVTAVEWAAKVGAALPRGAIRIEIGHGSDPRAPGMRRITIRDPQRERRERLHDAVADRPCPMCGQVVGAMSEHFPFCSPRCRMADLNRWFGGGYRVSRPLSERDVDET